MHKLYRETRPQVASSATGQRRTNRADAWAPYSLRLQAAAAVVQQVSSVTVKQVASAATLDLACRSMKGGPPDN